MTAPHVFYTWTIKRWLSLWSESETWETAIRWIWSNGLDLEGAVSIIMHWKGGRARGLRWGDNKVDHLTKIKTI